MSLEKCCRSPLGEFYAGKTVLLTGGSGFLGKLFIEKWIRCAVKEVLIVLRPKKGVNPEQRLRQLLSEVAVFARYRDDPQSYLAKIKVLEGDVSRQRLGLSDEDVRYVTCETDVIVHAAADVRFDESLKESTETNVRGTVELLKIAERCHRLKVFTYISSAFSQCIWDTVEEKFYQSLINPSTLISLLSDEQDLDAVEHISRKIIEPWPNTYAFTKSLAEDVVGQYRSKFPVAVIRPSIITSTSRDPIAGWTDNLYGINGVVVGAATGILRIFHVNEQYMAPIIPADVVVNSSLAATFYAVQHPHEENVFNCTSEENPVTWREVKNSCLYWSDKLPVKKSLWITTFNTTTSYWLATVLQLLYHLLPALFFELILRLRGSKLQLFRLYRRVHKFSDVLRFFATRQWTFRGARMRQVWDAMTPEDRLLFPCDIKTIEWGRFLEDCLRGGRLYMLGESPSKLPEAKRLYRRRLFAHRAMLATLYVALLWTIGRVLHLF